MRTFDESVTALVAVPRLFVIETSAPVTVRPEVPLELEFVSVRANAVVSPLRVYTDADVPVMEYVGFIFTMLPETTRVAAAVIVFVMSRLYPATPVKSEVIVADPVA